MYLVLRLCCTIMDTVNMKQLSQVICPHWVELYNQI